MEKQDLLTYVRELHSRHIESASRQGVTTWALAAGIVYLLWNLVPQLGAIAKLEDWRFTFYQNIAHIYVAIITGTVLIKSGRSALRKGPFDYRIRNNEFAEFLLALVFLSVTLGVPLYCSIFALSRMESGGFHALQLTVNTIALGFMALSGILAFGIQVKSRIQTGYPAPSLLMEGQSKTFSFLNFLMSVLTIELFIGNIHASLIPLVHEPDRWLLYFPAALNVSLLIIACLIAYLANQPKRDIEALARIERDIVLHDLSKEEIRNRLETDLLGQSFGGWISEKIAFVKERAVKLRELSIEHEAVLAAIDQIDPKFSYERSERLRVHLETLKNARNEYTKAAMPLIRWLNSARSARLVLDDRVILTVLEEATKELQQVLEECTKSVESAASALQEKLSSIAHESKARATIEPSLEKSV